jgi:hypothetical protein
MILVGPTIRSDVQAVVATRTREANARIDRLRVLPDMVDSEREWVGRVVG